MFAPELLTQTVMVIVVIVTLKRELSKSVHALCTPIFGSLVAYAISVGMDGGQAGRGSLRVVLMVSVLYQKRALPIAWLVYKGKKGHDSPSINPSHPQSVPVHESVTESVDPLTRT